MTDWLHHEFARGCLLGLAVGDALGAPLEGLSAHQVREHYDSVEDYVDGSKAWKRKPFRWRLPGLYSDDTQQALAVADVLLDKGKLDPDALANVYLALSHPRGAHVGAHRSISRSFRSVLTELERGASPRETGQGSAGAGAAMRIAPIAIHAQDDPDRIFEPVMAASLITHRDIRSLAGALAVAYAAQRLLQRQERSAGLLFRIAADVARAEDRIAREFGDVVTGLGSYKHSISRAIAGTEALLDRSRSAALAGIVDQANRHGAEPICRRPTMGFAVSLIPTCLYLLLVTDSFEEALIEVVNLGGDADTAGAVLGALAGAHYGADAIPRRWLNPLYNRAGIDLRAQALSAGTRGELEIPCLLETERHLTDLESRNRESLIAQKHLPRGGDRGATRHH